MSHTILNSRDVQQRLAAAMDAYRAAFEVVEKILREVGDLGELPPYVFAIDRLTGEQLTLLPPNLALAERFRRQERVALQCLAELIALEQLPGVDWSPPIPLQDPTKSDDDTQKAIEEASSGNTDSTDMDRFVSIMDFARRHGVIYINGTFRSVKKHGQGPVTTTKS